MTEESHGSANVAAGVVAALVIYGLVVWLFSVLAKEQIGAVALLTWPLPVFGVWAAVFYARGADD